MIRRVIDPKADPRKKVEPQVIACNPKKIIVGYDIVENGTIALVIKKINTMIKGKWSPLGSMQIYKDEQNIILYIQTMVKYKWINEKEKQKI